jgi:glycine cleavage system aminomethyltransferase T
VKFDHDFIGRAALEAIDQAASRRTVTLRWNSEDVIDIFASLYRSGEEYKTMEMPTTSPWSHGMVEHADRILLNGREVGISSGNIYSYFFRENLSMGCVDAALAAPGTELIVDWGDHGRRIKPCRVTVAPFPYLIEGRNSDASSNQ